MKKLITVILILSLLLPAAALATDVTSMTDQELKEMIAICSAELISRNTTDISGTLLFEHEGVQLFQNGDAVIGSGGFLRIPVIIVNNTNHEMCISIEDAICNGWSIYSSGASTVANSKKKDDLSFNVGDADVTSLDQIISLSFKWSVLNFDTFDTVYKQGEQEEHRFW